MSAMEDLLIASLDQAVARVTVRTSWGPPMVVVDPFRQTAGEPGAPGAGGGQPGGTFDPMRFLKPEITVDLRSGGQRVYRPYGDPGWSKWPLLLTGLTVGFTTLVYLAVKHRRK